MKFNHLFHLIIIFLFSMLVFNEGTAQNSQWVPIGPWGGNVSDLAIDPNNPDVLYTLIYSEVLQSTNGGEHWEWLGDLQDVEVPFHGLLGPPTKIIVNPLNSNELLAATHAYIGKSRDQGRTWEATSDTIGHNFLDIEFNPRNPEVVYTAARDQTIEDMMTAGGLFKSTDNGDSWKFIVNELTGKNIIQLEIDPVDTTVLYASAWDWGDGSEFNVAFYKSADAGTNWTALDVPLNDCWVSSVSVSPSNPQVIYIGTAGYSVWGCERSRVLKSEDGGATWIDRTGNLPESRSLSTVLADPRNADWVYVSFSDSGLFKTINGGTSWEKRNANSVDQFINEIVLHPCNPDTVYIATEIYGLHKSTDAGQSWDINSGDMSVGTPPFVIDPVNSNIVHAVSGKGIYKTDDGGQAWNYVYLFEESRGPILIANCKSDPNIVYVATSYHYEIYKTSDRGQSWQFISNIYESDYSAYIEDLVVSPDDADIVYAVTEDSGIFKSADGGLTWKAINEGLEELNMFMGVITINPLNPNTLYASTRKRIYKSINAGETWQAITPENFAANDISVSKADTSIVFVLTPYVTPWDDGKLLHSTDAGATWDTLSLPHPGEVVSFVVDPSDPETIYIGFRHEGEYKEYVFQTKNSGQTWTNISDGLADGTGRPVTFYNTNTPTLYAASRGIYRLDLTTDIDHEAMNQPEDFCFLQNYPNPFNAYTTIEYVLPTFSNVKLTIYNTLGKEVITMVNKKQAAGRYRVRWNGKDRHGRDTGSGIYLLELKTDQFSQVRRMLLIR